MGTRKQTPETRSMRTEVAFHKGEPIPLEQLGYGKLESEKIANRPGHHPGVSRLLLSSPDRRLKRVSAHQTLTNRNGRQFLIPARRRLSRGSINFQEFRKLGPYHRYLLDHHLDDRQQIVRVAMQKRRQIGGCAVTRSGAAKPADGNRR